MKVIEFTIIDKKEYYDNGCFINTEDKKTMDCLMDEITEHTNRYKQMLKDN